MARQFDNLYNEITTFANLYTAFKKAARGKRTRPVVAAFEYQLEGNLIRLRSQLRERSYCPGGYRSFIIQDPKRRLVSAAPFVDRVVHHSLCNLLEPIYEQVFINTSFANRKGRGTHAALDRAQRCSRQYPYVLQCDIRQFFPAIDHEVLFKILQKKIICTPTLELCRLILAGGAGILTAEHDFRPFDGDNLLAFCRPRGLPIGNLTSQFWANVLLNELDQFVQRELHCRAYLRYVDDFLLFADNKKILWQWKAAISEYLAALRLRLHERSSTVYPVTSGIPYLGFRLYPSRRRLKRRNIVAFKRRFERNCRAFGRGEIGYPELSSCVRGWVAHAVHGDTARIRGMVLNRPIPRPPRVILKIPIALEQKP